MSLKQAMVPYFDANGLVKPSLNSGSNNGVMYLCEYIIMLIRNKEATPADVASFLSTLERCMATPGLLERSPDNAGGQEGPDDYYAVAAALDEIQAEIPECGASARDIAREFITYSLHHWFALDNVTPGAFQWNAVLGRQFQLDACVLWAASYLVGPILRATCFVTMLFSCKGVPANQADPRRLAWLLVQVATRHSAFCRVAAKVWYNRLYSVYPSGMKGVAANYYEAGHPFITYWIDKSP